MPILALYTLALVISFFDTTFSIVFAVMATSFVDDITVLVAFFMTLIISIVRKTGRFTR